MDRDHRHVGEPRQWISAGAVLSERLQHERHRNQFAVILDQHRETGRIGQPVTYLPFALGGINAGNRPQGKPKLHLPSDVGRCPEASDNRDIGRVRNAHCQH